MIQVDFGLILFHKQNTWQVPECVTLVFCSGREVQLVWGWMRIATALGGVWLLLQDQEMARCRSTRKSYNRMRALQQLTCLVGKDEYWRES